MGKKKKRKSQKPTLRGQGIDLGITPNVMAVSDSSITMNNALRESKVFGMAYGFDRLPGCPYNLPILSIISEKEEPLSRAFDVFENWGALDDGDVVSIAIILKSDGSYLFTVSPDYERFMHRTIRDSQVLSPLLSGATWIKPIDTTNPTLREWRQHQNSKLFPIIIDGATATSKNGAPDMSTISQLPNRRRFVKFNLEILDADEDKDHYLVRMAVGKSDRERPRGPKPRGAQEIANSRKRVIDVRFPVSRDRIRRKGLLEQIREEPQFINLAQSQFEQAVINTVICQEHFPDAINFEGIDGLNDRVWEIIQSKAEVVTDPNNIPSEVTDTLKAQIILDTNHTLRRHGISISPKFKTNQNTYLRLGYGS